MEPIDNPPPPGAPPTAFPEAGAARRPTPVRQRFTLLPEAVGLSRARRRVRDYLNLYCRERRTVDDMVVCVGEACTNAIRHGGSSAEIEVFLGFRGDDLEILVKDKGRGFETAAFDPEIVPDLLSEDGRGLFLMSQLADEMALHRDCGLQVRLLKRAVLAAPSPADELDGAFAAASGATITRRWRAVAARDERRNAPSESDRCVRTLFAGLAEGVALHELVERDGRPVDYRILDVNPSFERLTGLAADQARGRLASELYGMAAPFLEHYAQVATGGEPRVLGAYFAPTQRHLRITAVSPESGRFATIIEDVTALRRAAEERQRLTEETEALAEKLRIQGAQLKQCTPPPAQAVEPAAQELAERVALAEALNALNRGLRSTPDGEAPMQGMLEQGVRALAAAAGAIELREEPDWVVRYQCGLGAAELGRHLSRNQAPNATRAASYREPLATADLQAAASDGGLASAHGLRSVLAVPLLSGEAVSGCLLFYGRAVRVFSDAEIDFGRTLGAIVSLAVETVRLRQELRRATTAEAQ